MSKTIYRVANKETNKTIAWFTDSQDMFYLSEWYEGSEIKLKTEKYELVDEW